MNYDTSSKINKSLFKKKLKRKIFKKSIENFHYYPTYHHHHYHHYYNSYQYHQSKVTSNEFINFKLKDLIKPNSTFIDNLYAQIHSNTNKINLFYIPTLHNNTRAIDENLFYNDPTRRFNYAHLTSQNNSNESLVNTNNLINEFYLSAFNLDPRLRTTFSNFNEGDRMPRLLTSEIFLIGFVISLWLISILICLKRYSLFICFHKRDVPFYNASLINVSTKIGGNETTSPQMSPHHHHHQWNPVENEKDNECAISSKATSNAFINKPITQTTNFTTFLNYDPCSCHKCSKNKIIHSYKSLSNGNFKTHSCSKIHKNFSFNSNYANNFRRDTKFNKQDYYFSNGVIYPIKQNSSSMLNKVSSSPKTINKPQPKFKDSLTAKRAVIRSKHFNLMSLDENALYRLNRISHLNSTIHESSVDNPEFETKEPTKDKKLSFLAANATQHNNFISLRSGSDSANSSWIKPGRSYDYENFECIDLESSSSLQQSQSHLKPPSLNKLNNPILPTSQRPINPISSLRRHMFVNSRRCAQTTFDRNVNDSMMTTDQSVEFFNSMSIASNNLSVIPAICDDQEIHENKTKEPSVEVVNECNDPNLLNPDWIPLIVRRTLLEMHERAVLSKSDSNIKSKYRSSNHLLHSSTSHKNNAKLKVNRKKKSLSLQNSQDKTTYYSPSQSNNRSTGSSYLNNFYEELRQKFFQLNSNETKNTPSNEKKAIDLNQPTTSTVLNKSTSNSNTISTDVSTVVLRFDSKFDSLDRQHSNSNMENLLNENSFEEEAKELSEKM